jgi:hypothetical protein
MGLNDEYLAHHSGMLTDAYLDHYRPELLLYHTYWLGPLPPPTARQEAAARANFGARLPMVVTALRGYAERHGYTLAAVYGSQYCDFHYIWVRSDSPDTAAILSAVRDHPYGWQYTDAPTFDFRREEKKDTCQTTLSGGRPPVPPSF